MAHAKLWKRAAAVIIDSAILIIAFYVLFFLDSLLPSISILFSIIIILSFPLYFSILESKGQTLGKRIIGIKVVHEGESPGFWRALIRTLLRIVDMLPVFYLLGALLIFLTKKEQRLGDIIAGTTVVDF
jgi:uncharacterized RDD family membrane protein YckC